ncbi:hypothetical protein OUZ56_010844 [Daphnia magna]|uniref:Uncharacterized protein n=1 Tax=Daphnia magna TaxID=35525 RepID=A0ABQ9YYN2_9CRUS|nr:hypothetical protein OUZ56_010844 [Daphnia magna]
MPALIVLQLLPEFDFLSQKHDINREPISVTSGVPSVGMSSGIVTNRLMSDNSPGRNPTTSFVVEKNVQDLYI